MKPLQLLNMGKSIRETKDEPHRYKMTAQNALPTFGAVKNPPARPAMEKRTSTTMKTDTMEMTHASSVKTAPSVLARFPLGRWTFRRNPFQPRAVTASVQTVVQSDAHPRGRIGVDWRRLWTRSGARPADLARPLRQLCDTSRVRTG